MRMYSLFREGTAPSLARLSYMVTVLACAVMHSTTQARALFDRHGIAGPAAKGTCSKALTIPAYSAAASDTAGDNSYSYLHRNNELYRTAVDIACQLGYSQSNIYSIERMMGDDDYLARLRTHWKRHQAFPSMAKLCDVVGLSSTSSIFALVGRLVDAGYLERVEGRIAPTRKFFARLVLGSVRAGQPEPETQDAPELLTIDDYLIDDPNRTTLCRVRGDSMKDAGLLDGDLVTVERNSPTVAGDIVVAVVDGELTVKYLRMTRKREFYLEAANLAYKPIHPKGSLEIIGVVTGVIRRYRRCP
jgi:repressor LexA